LFVKKREHSDTLEALQQELDNLQEERRDLKEKLRLSTKKTILDNLMNRQMSEVSSPEAVNKSIIGSSDSNILLHELKVAKDLNEMLRKNTYEAKKELANKLLDKLPSINKLSTRETTSAEIKLAKKTNNLVKVKHIFLIVLIKIIILILFKGCLYVFGKYKNNRFERSKSKTGQQDASFVCL
jgi:hypothetical protein